MNSTHKKLTIGIVIAIIVIALLVLVLKAAITPNTVAICDPHKEVTLTPNEHRFAEQMRDTIVNATGAHPIEGFEPDMFLGFYTKLKPSDFECVQALQGHYSVKEGRVTFIPSVPTQQQHTAARAISDTGMSTLLRNIASRTDTSTQTIEDIDAIVRDIR